MATELAVGYVSLVPSARGIGRHIGRQLGPPTQRAAEDAGDDAGRSFSSRFGRRLDTDLAKTTKTFDKFGAISDKNKAKLAGMGKAFASAMAPITKAKSIGALAAIGGSQVASAFGGALISGVTKAVHGAGAAIALLPAIAATGALAFGTIKLAVQGVSDAISSGLEGDTEAFNEALKGLSPSARVLARDVVGLKDRFDGLRRVVQERFFAPFTGDIKVLGGAFLPVLRSEMGSLAGTFGRTIHAAAGFLTLPSTVLRLTAALSNGRRALANLAAGVVNLFRAFVPLVTVGSTFLPGLTGGFAGATARVAEFMEEAERTGRLAGWIQGGLDKLRELWETAKQVGRIFFNLGDIARKVFEAVSITPPGQGWLDVIEGATAAFSNFLDTAAGSEAIQRTLSILSSLFGGVLEIGTRLALTLGAIFGPLLPDIEEAVNAFSAFKTSVLNSGIDVLTPLLAGLAAVLGGVVLPALTQVFNFLGRNRGVTRGLGIAITAVLVPSLIMLAVHFVKTKVEAVKAAIAHSRASAATIAGWVGAKAAAVANAAVIVGKWVLMAARATVSAARTAIAWAVGHIAPAATAVASMIAASAVVVAKWVLMGVQSLLAAAKIALAWVISMGPIALIIAAVIGLVVVIVRNWDTIKRVITGAAKAVLDFLRRNWPLILAIITGPIGIAVLLVIRHWDKIKGAIAAAVRFVLNIIRTVLGAARDFIVTAFRTARDLLFAVLTGIKNGIVTAANFVRDKVRAGFNAARDAITGAFRGARDTLSGILTRIKDMVGGAVTWVRDQVKEKFRAVKDGILNALRGARDAMGAILDRVKAKVKGPVNSIIRFINSLLGGLDRVLELLPGDLSLNFRIPGLSTGGTIGGPVKAFAKGGVPPFITNGPRAIVGEGNRCIARGTLIETSTGPQTIESIRPGTLVLTRHGYRKVLWAGLTRPDADVVELRTRVGKVVCTPDHTVWSTRGAGHGDQGRDRMGRRPLRGGRALPHQQVTPGGTHPPDGVGDDRPGHRGPLPRDHRIGQPERAAPAASQDDVHRHDLRPAEDQARDHDAPAMVGRTTHGAGPAGPGSDRRAGPQAGAPGPLLQARPRADVGEHLHVTQRAQDVPHLQEGHRPRLDAPEARWHEAGRLDVGDWVWVLVAGELEAQQLVSVTAAASTDTYDLTVDQHPEFVAGGVLVHNSYPEYVIPTDPAYRGRAQHLATEVAGRLGIPMLAGGGIIGDIAGAVSGAVGAGLGAFRRGAALAIFRPIKAVFDRAVGGLPWAFLRHIGGAFVGWLEDFVTGVDNRGGVDPESSTGGGGSATGLVGAAAVAFQVFRRMFPGMTIGGWRARGSVPGSDHPKGKALDLMTGSSATANEIISTFLTQPGAKYWIWNRQIAQQSGGWNPRGYSGPSPHTDHVHLSYYRRGGVLPARGYETGAWEVGTAGGRVHGGEMVLNRRLADGVRALLGGPGNNGTGGGGPAVHIENVHLHDGVDVDLLNSKLEFAIAGGRL